MRPARAVLLDFAGTLLVPEPREQWVAAVRPDLDAAARADLAERLDRAGRPGGPEPERLPEALADEYARRDVSREAHRAVYEQLLAPVAGSPSRTAALYDRSTSPPGWVAYPDALPVLRELRRRGVPVAVVSNVGFDLRAVFVAHGLDGLVTAYVLSYERGLVKPRPELFAAGCAALGVEPQDALMVGDNPVADAGGVALGVRTLLLPYSPAGRDHGLEAVLRLVGD